MKTAMQASKGKKHKPHKKVFGRSPSEETRKKISETLKLRYKLNKNNESITI